MQRAELIDLLDTARADGADRATISASIAATTRLMAWCEARNITNAHKLQQSGAPAETVLATTSRCNSRDAERVVQRANTASKAPVFADALAEGRVAGGHLDQLSNSLRRLESDQQATLLADAPRLLAIAAQSTPDEFARTLRAEERRLATDDGMSRLQKQRAAVRLAHRLDIVTGMHHFNLTVDPVTGLKLHNQIRAVTEDLFHDAVPELCPTDSLEKQSFLRAHALLAIIDGKGIRLGKPEIVVVVDTAASDASGAPAVDWGLPVDIPIQVLRDLFHVADVHTIVVRNGVVLHAPGELNLGRTTRLANRAQRRALRATYATCAIPGCATRFDYCKIHHVHWWRHGGPTDLRNLLPICSKHHTLIHHGSWDLHLAPDRTLTITLPDGTTMTTGPPKRNAA